MAADGEEVEERQCEHRPERVKQCLIQVELLLWDVLDFKEIIVRDQWHLDRFEFNHRYKPDDEEYTLHVCFYLLRVIDENEEWRNNAYDKKDEKLPGKSDASIHSETIDLFYGDTFLCFKLLDLKPLNLYFFVRFFFDINQIYANIVYF